MNLTAIIPAANLQSANAALQAQGFGPGNFSVVAFTGAVPTHAALHAWQDAAFAAAVKVLPGVAWLEYPTGEVGDPVSATQALIAAQSAAWGAQAPVYGGQLESGKLYRYEDGSLWSCITGYDTATYSAHPSTYPALIRRARTPGVAEPWTQPLDQFDAYKLLLAFTGLPEQAIHNDHLWEVNAADGAGNNTWPPGTYGWTDLGPVDGAAPAPAPAPEDEWPAWKPWAGNNADLYQVGAKTSHNGFHWVSTTPNNHWEPGIYGWAKQ